MTVDVACNILKISVGKKAKKQAKISKPRSAIAINIPLHSAITTVNGETYLPI